MMIRTLSLIALSLAMVGTNVCFGSGHGLDEQGNASDELVVMAWNIWHGGREDGETVGPQRVVDVIQSSGADIVAMQETYGSGEFISSALKFHFAPRGTNVSIHSRYPIVEDISVYEEFKCVGAMVALPDGSRLAFYSIWLPYSAEIWQEGTRDSSDPDSMLAACDASKTSLEAMYALIEQRLAGEEYDDVPIMIAGDFNSMSHLDYGEVGWDQYGVTVDWPTSHILMRQGFEDTYRTCNPQIDRTKDSTWTPRFPQQEQDRIDFIYSRSSAWNAIESRVERTHPDGFPSDHAAVVTTFRRSDQTHDEAPQATALRAVSYNIKHGRGMDGEVQLSRTAGVLAQLKPDFVALQEVDLGATRSGGVNQVNELAGILSMHPAFGSFMDYQGGKYGMAILSRYPIADVTSLRLPDGNEPRIALIATVLLPDNSLVKIVNVHFDWVADDSFRIRQARVVADYLRNCNLPFVLLGDFNDVKASPTLELFKDVAREVEKPLRDRFTFPSDDPNREIDFIWCGPIGAWKTEQTSVVDEAVASDHRPIVANLKLIESRDEREH